MADTIDLDAARAKRLADLEATHRRLQEQSLRASQDGDHGAAARLSTEAARVERLIEAMSSGRRAGPKGGPLGGGRPEDRKARLRELFVQLGSWPDAIHALVDETGCCIRMGYNYRSQILQEASESMGPDALRVLSRECIVTALGVQLRVAAEAEDATLRVKAARNLGQLGIGLARLSMSTAPVGQEEQTGFEQAGYDELRAMVLGS